MLRLAFFDINNNVVGRFGVPTNIVFTTKLPGGCDQLTCQIGGAFEARWQESRNPLIRRCELTDSLASVVWSGRLSQPVMAAQHTTLTFEGYWYALWDTWFSLPDPGLTSPVHVQDILTRILQFNAPSLSQSLDWLDTSNLTDLAASAAYTHVAANPGDVMVELLKISNGIGQQYYAAVYPLIVAGVPVPVLRYFPRPATPTWYVSLAGLDPSWQFTADWTVVYSGVTIEYTGLDGVRAVSPAYTASDTQARLGYVHTNYVSLPSTTKYDPATIDNLGALYLQEHQYPPQRATSLTITREATVRNVNGVIVPSYYVQAGDVVAVLGLPVANDNAGIGDDTRTIFTVIGTTYSVDDGTLSFVPDVPPTTLESIVAQLVRG